MTPTPVVSVIIPTFNRRASVQEAIASALAQTETRCEIIVVDDGSTDGTAATLTERFAAEPRVRLLEQVNAGCSAARNAGIDAAAAPWVAFLDSDDLYLPEFLASQLATLATDPSAAGAYCDGRFSPGWQRGPLTLFAERGQGPAQTPVEFLDGAPAAIVPLVLRTEIARTVRFDEALRSREDLEFMVRLVLARHRLLENRDVLWIYRHDADCPEGAAQKSRDWLPVHEAHIKALQPLAAVPGTRTALRRVLRPWHEHLAHHYWRAGERRKARPHCRALTRSGPRRGRWWTRYLRSFIPSP